ncbi:hypothetical protein QMK95_29575 [Klebsiella pneumoniae]|uniref:hypothetical protein n=1 Tax=Klebsiella pneumoniae TaxID=573 RepID=UPI003A888B16
MRKVCRCAAYNFPHRLDGGKCRELYNQQVLEEAKETLEWHEYFAQRKVNDKQMHQSGHSERDFI